jgi:transposase
LSRGDLSEAEWRLLEPLLPPERGRKSRPAFDNRQIVNGILWRIRTGAPAKSQRDNWREKAIASCLFTFVYFRSSTRRRFLHQFDLIVINGGTDEIL